MTTDIDDVVKLYMNQIHESKHFNFENNPELQSKQCTEEQDLIHVLCSVVEYQAEQLALLQHKVNSLIGDNK